MQHYDLVAQATADGDFDTREEVVAFFSSYLHKSLPSSLIESLLQAQRNFRRRQESLIYNLEGGTITQEYYFEELSVAMTGLMADSRRLLGEDDFLKVYGEVGMHPEALIDRERFLGSQIEKKGAS